MQQAAPSWELSEPEPLRPQAGDGQQIKVVAVFTLVLASLSAIGAIVFLVLFGSSAFVTGTQGDAPGWVPGLLAGLGLVIGSLFAVTAAFGFVGGSRLLRRRRSGKVPTMVFAALALPGFPFGTAYGIYALVTLAGRGAEAWLVEP